MQHLTLPLPATCSRSLVFGDSGVKALMESYVVVPVNEVIQAFEIVSVPVVSVKEILYLTVCLGMLYPGCYQLYAQGL